MQNLTSNSVRESEKGLKPHSYAVNFSASSIFVERTNDRKKMTVDKTILKTKKRKILKQLAKNINQRQ